MSKKRQKFTAEFREEAAKMVVEQSRPVVSVAREIGGRFQVVNAPV